MKFGRCRKEFGGKSCRTLRQSTYPKRRCAFDKQKIACQQRMADMLKAAENKNAVLAEAK